MGRTPIQNVEGEIKKKNNNSNINNYNVNKFEKGDP